MGFLTEFFEQVLNEENAQSPIVGVPPANAAAAPPTEAPANSPSRTEARPSSFEELSDEQLEEHLRVDRYDDFLLTDAIRPSFDLKVVPKAGFRREMYHDEESGSKIPVLMASASRERLFEIFLDLIEPLGNVVDVVLESSHNRDVAGHEDMLREHIDAPVLKSVLYEFEDLLMNDGCCGMAVMNSKIPNEVQFDEHKLLIVYGNDLDKYESILQSHGLDRDDEMRFITEAEHVHSSSDGFVEKFGELKVELGIDGDGSYDTV